MQSEHATFVVFAVVLFALALAAAQLIGALGAAVQALV
jgi:nitrate reductase NapE component